MPGPYPVEMDVTLWQGTEVELLSINCDAPRTWHGSNAINCHVRFNYEPVAAPEPSLSALGIGVLAIAAVFRRRPCARWV